MWYKPRILCIIGQVLCHRGSSPFSSRCCKNDFKDSIWYYATMQTIALVRRIKIPIRFPTNSFLFGLFSIRRGEKYTTGTIINTAMAAIISAAVVM